MSAPLRILFVSRRIFSPPRTGGDQRSLLLLEALRLIGIVDCLFLDEDSLRRPDAVLKIESDFTPDLFPPASSFSRKRRVGCLWYSIRALLGGNKERWIAFRSADSFFKTRIESYDIVVSRYLYPACRLNCFLHPRLVIDVDDYDPDRLRQRISTAGWFKRLTLMRCLRYSQEAHRNLLPRAAHCWVSNPADRRHPGLEAATILPNIPYFPAGLPQLLPPPPLKGPPVFLIVGTLSYSANSDGIDAFLREAWLMVRAQVPNVELDIVGQGMSISQRKRWGRFPGVKPIGFVESLSESYARCVATLAPILAGGGTNIKVLESSAYGRPCVVSRVAHRGFEETLPDGLACLRAERISDMAVVCLRLIHEPDLARRIGGAARHAIEQYYTMEKFVAAVREGFASTRGKYKL